MTNNGNLKPKYLCKSLHGAETTQVLEHFQASVGAGGVQIPRDNTRQVGMSACWDSSLTRQEQAGQQGEQNHWAESLADILGQIYGQCKTVGKTVLLQQLKKKSFLLTIRRRLFGSQNQLQSSLDCSLGE